MFISRLNYGLQSYKNTLQKSLILDTVQNGDLKVK